MAASAGHRLTRLASEENTTVDSVIEQVWRYPVKSMGGERVESSWADAAGLLGDRLWAVLDSDGKLGSGKNTRRFKRITALLDLNARYLAEPRTAGIEPPVLTGPDGISYPVASGAADDFVRKFTGLPHVRVRRDTGIMHFDETPFSLIGTATIGWLAAQVPDALVEARRLRPNVVVRTAEPFAEESWLGRVVRLGDGADVAQVVFDRVLQRCVMVGMAQPGLTESGMILKRIAQRKTNSLCLAIGGRITGAGVIRVGDCVVISPEATVRCQPLRSPINIKECPHVRAAPSRRYHSRTPIWRKSAMIPAE